MTATELLFYGLNTTLWVSALTVLVLVLRKPVANRFGSRAALLLWSLPAIRLLAPAIPKEVGPEPMAPMAPATTPMLSEAALTQVPQVMPAAERQLTLPGPTIPLQSTELHTSFAFSLPTSAELAAVTVSLWFAGVLTVLFLCWSRGRTWRQTLIAESRPVSGALSERARRAARHVGYRRSFELLVTDAAETPQVMGLRRPILAVPAKFETMFSPDEQDMALTHELVHLRRNDLLVLHLAEIGFALQWFNPLVKTARQALRSDQEAACDEAVRGLGVNTKRYAELLLKSAGLGRPVPALTLDHSLKERIVRMQLPVSAPLKRAVFILAASASAIAVAGFTASRVEVAAAVQEDERSERRSVRGEASDQGRARLEELLSELSSLEDDLDDLEDELDQAMEEGGMSDQRMEEIREEIEIMHEERDRMQDEARESRRLVREKAREARERAREGREAARRAREAEKTRGKAEDGRIAFLRVDGGADEALRSVLHRKDSVKVKVIGRPDRWGDNQSIVLLNDPFAELTKMKPADPPVMDPPRVKAPELKTKETEEGTWMLIPSEPDMTEFEASMEKFEEVMEAWGEEMEVWGEKMGNAGEAVGELAEECEDHISESDRPVILEQRIDDSRDTVRALCASGGMERFQSAEIEDFLRSEGVSREELRTFRDSISG
jgi:beta-lactamase regulating signal transducer with metallopeptidase domain